MRKLPQLRLRQFLTDLEKVPKKRRLPTEIFTRMFKIICIKRLTEGHTFDIIYLFGKGLILPRDGRRRPNAHRTCCPQ